jgi:hypothetical protein
MVVIPLVVELLIVISVFFQAEGKLVQNDIYKPYPAYVKS